MQPAPDGVAISIARSEQMLRLQHRRAGAMIINAQQTGGK